MKRSTGKYVTCTPQHKQSIHVKTSTKPPSLPPSKPKPAPVGTSLGLVLSSRFAQTAAKCESRSDAEAVAAPIHSTPLNVPSHSKQPPVTTGSRLSVERSRAQKRNEDGSEEDSPKESNLNSSQGPSDESLADIKKRLNEKAVLHSRVNNWLTTRERQPECKRAPYIAPGHVNPSETPQVIKKKLNIVISASPAKGSNPDLHTSLNTALAQLSCIKTIWDANSGTARQAMDSLRSPPAKQRRDPRADLEQLKSSLDIMLSPKVVSSLEAALKNINDAAARAHITASPEKLQTRNKEQEAELAKTKLSRLALLVSAVRNHKKAQEDVEERNAKLVREVLNLKGELKETRRQLVDLKRDRCAAVNEVKELRSKLREATGTLAEQKTEELRKELETERARTRLMTAEKERLVLETCNKDLEYARKMQEIKELFENALKEKQAAMHEVVALKKELIKVRPHSSSVHDGSKLGFAKFVRPASIDSQNMPTQPSSLKFDAALDTATAETRFYKDHVKQLLALKGISQCLFKSLLEEQPMTCSREKAKEIRHWLEESIRMDQKLAKAMEGCESFEFAFPAALAGTLNADKDKEEDKQLIVRTTL